MTATVSMRQVSKHWGSFIALRELDLALNPGEVLGLLGHNGAGKSTTMKLILGLYPQTGGQVEVFGVSPYGRIGRAGRAKLGYLPENVSFYDQLSGREVLTYFAKLKSAPRSQVMELLEMLGLAAFANKRVRTYSKGMRQRLGLAQALLGEPELLLLDEPTVGLDPVATQELYKTIDARRRQGTAILLCSHVLPGIEPYIDRVMILSRGHLLASGTLQTLREEAGLPSKIVVRGRLPEALSLPGGVRVNHESEDLYRLELAEADKLPVLQSLLPQPIEDLWMEQPSLEDLYIHFNRLGAAA